MTPTADEMAERGTDRYIAARKYVDERKMAYNRTRPFRHGGKAV